MGGIAGRISPQSKRIFTGWIRRGTSPGLPWNEIAAGCSHEEDEEEDHGESSFFLKRASNLPESSARSPRNFSFSESSRRESRLLIWENRKNLIETGDRKNVANIFAQTAQSEFAAISMHALHGFDKNRETGA